MKKSLLLMLLLASCAPATVLTGCSSFDSATLQTPTTLDTVITPSNTSTSSSTGST